MSHFNKEDLEGLKKGANDYRGLSQAEQAMLATVVSEIGIRSLETPKGLATSSTEAIPLNEKSSNTIER